MKKLFQKKYVSIASVVVLGITLGLVIQFARAWAPPTASAPGNNIGAPITTGNYDQEKAGGTLTLRGVLSALGDITTDLISANIASLNTIQFADGSEQITALEKSVPRSLCIAPDAATGLCQDNFFMKGPSLCCPFNSKVATLPNTWYTISEVGFSAWQRDPDNYWSNITQRAFTAPKTISAVRVTGYSDDGGYCYAYWGSGHLATQRHDGRQGIYNMDNSLHSDYTYSDEFGTYTVPDSCPTYPATFDNNGNVQICQEVYNAGPLGTVQSTGLNISAGTIVFLQGRHAIGNGDDGIVCNLEVQYAN